MIDPNILLKSQTPTELAQGAANVAQTNQQTQNLANVGQLQQGELAQQPGQLQMQAQQLTAAQQENQQRQNDLNDQQAIRKAWIDAGGNLQQTQALALQYGASPKALMTLNSTMLDQATKRATLDKDTLANNQTRNDALSGMLQPVLAESDPQKQAALWTQAQGTALQRGLIQPQDIAQHPYPGPDGVKMYAASLQTDSDINKQAEAQGRLKQGQAALMNAQRQGSNLDVQRAAGQLSNAPNQAVYEQIWNQLPAGVAKQFTPPEQWTSDTPQSALKVGMTPDQIASSSQRAQEIAKLNSPAELAMKAAKGDPDAQAAMNLLKQQSIDERKASQQPPIVITPQAQTMLANNFTQSGNIPTIPRGPGGQVVAGVINQAAANNPTANLASNKATYKADSGSLAGLQKQRDAVGAFEQTASNNLNLFINAASKIPDSNSPWLNTPLRMLSDKVAGSANMAAVNAARQVANNEIAKVTSNPTLSGTLSDSARHEVMAYNPQNATFKQTVAVANILRQDMQNRRIALDQGISQIKGRLSGGGQPAAAAAPAKSLDQIFGSN